MQHDCQEFLALLLDTLHEQLNEDSSYTKAIDEGNKDNDTVERRQQSVQSEDSEIPGSANQSGAQSPADRSTSQSPVEQTENLPNNTNIVRHLSSVGDGASTCLTHNKLQYVSEDSNQSETRSEVSYQSSELLPPEDHEQRMKAIPEEVKQGTSTADISFKPISDADPVLGDIENVATGESPPGTTSEESKEVCVNTSEKETEDADGGNSAAGDKRLSLEDFYMKDTKTLNLNVLAEEYMHEEVATDSEKFHKHDNVDRPSDPFETLSDFIMNEVKSPTSKPLKDSNLLANFKEKFSAESEAFPKKCLFSDIKNLRGEEETEWNEATNSTVVTGFCSINNIKRMKIDEDEKNVRMQARLKVNTNKNPTKEDDSSNIRLLSPGDQAGHRGEGDNTVRLGTSTSSLSQRTADMTTSPLEEQIRAQNLAEAERAWKKYLKNNRSIIVDTFQGQFKSTVSLNLFIMTNYILKRRIHIFN